MYQRMSDKQLEYTERQIRLKLAQLRPALSPFSVRLLTEYQGKLDGLLAERARRKATTSNGES